MTSLHPHRRFSFQDAFVFKEDQYLVLNMPSPKNLLSTVIENSDLWPLPRRHVLEIALQIAAAVQSMSVPYEVHFIFLSDFSYKDLHDEERVVGNLSPKHIEFNDPRLVSQMHYDRLTRRFHSKASINGV